MATHVDNALSCIRREIHKTAAEHAERVMVRVEKQGQDLRRDGRRSQAVD